MRELGAPLLVLVLALGACSSPQGTEPGEIAALDEAQGDDAAANDLAESDEGSRPGKKKGSDADRGARAGASGGGGAADTGGGGGGGGGTASETGGGNPPAPSAQAAVPIPQGRHEYATDGERNVSGNEQPMPETTTLTAAAPADGLQRQTRDLRDSEGNGVVTETDVLYRDDGVFLSYVKITSRFQGGLTDVREFRLPRPELVAPAGAGPGAARSFTMEGSGTRAKVTIRAHRYESVTVGGSRVRALVVQTDIAFSGALEGNQRSLTWFWPKHLLPVREQVHTDVRNGPIRLQSSYEATIRRLP